MHDLGLCAISSHQRHNVQRISHSKFNHHINTNSLPAQVDIYCLLLNSNSKGLRNQFEVVWVCLG